MAESIKENPDVNWLSVFKDMTKEGISKSFLASREYLLAKDQYTATLHDDFMALALVIRDRIIERWITTQQKYHSNNVKRVYYLSMEFLLGKMLESNILNLGLQEQVKLSMEEQGFNLEELYACEPDAGLGNGGLGRLAACFLDSLATLSIPAHGYGIRYEYGIFNQKIINGCQVEHPEEWLSKGNPWELARLEYTVKVRFYGHTYLFHDNKGRLKVSWVDTEDVLAMPYDVPICGYKSDTVNTLRLWSARSSEEFDLKFFNDGDYERAVYNKVYSENISKILYPNDNSSQGKELRLKQEYFFIAASLSDIIRRFKKENSDFSIFSDKAAIHLNDTHPALAIAELMRILVDEENIDWDTAWYITVKTFAYTNHTVMQEALETWKVSLLELVLPRHLMIIYEINMRFLKEVAIRFPGDNERLRRMSIIEEGENRKVRMAHLAIIGSHSINGVSALHTEILKKDLFRDFYAFYPGRFNNKTNGMTQRRWLKKSNPRLSELITDTIGDKWITNLHELEKLNKFKDDYSFRLKWRQIKGENKKNFADFIYKETGIPINPESMFDVQIKRIHEYKRQLLFGLYIISEYLKIKNNLNGTYVPRTMIIGGKAAPGYTMAKLIIKFLNNVADIINNDSAVSDKLKVIFLENYRVSLAEKIFPASDLSEQISTAGMEASGTGCMKFMVNGALTIGTLDGANVELCEAAGKDNFFIFGLTIEQIFALKTKGYNPKEYIDRSPLLTNIIALIQSNFFSATPSEYNMFSSIIENLFNPDTYFICADFEPYLAAQNKVSELFNNKDKWTEKSIINVSRSGKFSTDRTIREYLREIWDIPCDK